MPYRHAPYFAGYATIPQPVTMASGLAAGAAAAWFGWQAGKLRPRRLTGPA